MRGREDGAGSTCLANTAMSSLKESEEHTSPPAAPGSRGVHVASSHFSNTSASSGKSGWLRGEGGVQGSRTGSRTGSGLYAPGISPHGEVHRVTVYVLVRFYVVIILFYTSS